MTKAQGLAPSPGCLVESCPACALGFVCSTACLIQDKQLLPVPRRKLSSCKLLGIQLCDSWCGALQSILHQWLQQLCTCGLVVKVHVLVQKPKFASVSLPPVRWCAGSINQLDASYSWLTSSKDISWEPASWFPAIFFLPVSWQKNDLSTKVTSEMGSRRSGQGTLWACFLICCSTFSS